MYRLISILVLLLAMLALSGCPGSGKPRPPAAASWKDEEDAHKAGLALSLFKGTPMATSPPDAISFSRDCSTLFVHGVDRMQSTDGHNVFYLARFDVGKGKLSPLEPYITGPDLIVPYLQSSPDGDEVLCESQTQPRGKTVRDVIYRAGPIFGEKLKYRSLVPWEAIPNLPKGAFETTYVFTKPFYSWDAKEILIPFNNDTGIGVIDKRTGGGTYVAYPRTKIIGGWTGNAFGPLGDAEGKHQIWGSFWRIGNEQDDCEIYTLDLDRLKWTKVMKLDWAVYNCAASNPDVDPWLLRGSYSQLVSGDEQLPAVQRSGMRIPRLARAIAGADKVDTIPMYGDPVWEIALDPLEGRVFYDDLRRQGLVRYSLADGKLDIDTRWYTKDDQSTHIYTSTGGDRCFIWQTDVLIEADWQHARHEDEKGYDEQPVVQP